MKAADDVVDPRVKSRLFVQIRDDSHPHVSEEQLAEFISQRAPWFEANITDLLWSAVIRFERRLAQSFGGQRVWLVGDAGHLVFPVGIQSMNIGFKEASRLSQHLLSAVRAGSSVDALTAYESECLEEWNELLGISGSVEVSEGAEGWVRAYSDRIPSCIPASGTDLKRLLRGIGLLL